jgi:curved DNA-binding protein CbpA
MPDYYNILEVSPTATQAEIKRSYRRLVRKYHPDLNKQALDLQIKRLNEAYNVISDPVKRAAYDVRHSEEIRRAAPKVVPQHRPTPVKREPEMTWVEGLFGFIKELKKGLREDL